MRFLHHIAAWSARRPYFAIPAVVLFTTALSTSFLIAEEAEISELFVPTDMKEFRAFKEIQDTFGQGEILVIAWETSDPLAANILRNEAHVTAEVLQIDGIWSATTLSGLLDLSASDQRLEQEARGFCQERPDVCGRLVADDMLLATYSYDPASSSNLVVDAVNPIIGSQQVDARLLATGQPYSEVAFDEAGQGDVQLLLPLALVAIVVVLAVLFRTVSDVIIPLVTVFFSLAWAYASLPLVGVPFNPLLFSVMPLLLGIGIDYQMHIVYSLHEQSHRRPLWDRFRAVARDVGPPVYYTALTTLIGFGSFLFSKVPQVRYWGVLIGLGAFYAFLLGFLLLPALYRLRREKTQVHSSAGLERRLDRLGGRMLARRGRVLIGLGAVSAVVLAGIAVLEVNAAIDVDLDDSHPYIQANHEVEERFGGQVIGYVLLHGGLERGDMIALQDGLSDIEGVSFVDGPISRMRVAEGSVPQGAAYQEALRASYQEGAVASGKGLVTFGYDFDFEKAIVPALEEILDDEQIDHTLSGQFIIQIKSQSIVLDSLITSTMIAAGLVLIVLIAVLRQPRLIATAYAPMLVVVGWQLGFQGYLGIPMNAVTGITTAMVLGIGIDYALHITSHFRNGLLDGRSRSEAAQKAIVHVGKPVLAGSLTTVAAFVVLAFSNTSQLNQFGQVAAIVVASAFFISLIMVPLLSSYGRTPTGIVSSSRVPHLRRAIALSPTRRARRKRQRRRRQRSEYEKAKEFADSLYWR